MNYFYTIVMQKTPKGVIQLSDAVHVWALTGQKRGIDLVRDEVDEWSWDTQTKKLKIANSPYTSTYEVT